MTDPVLDPANASAEQLRAVLLTCDGRGMDAKMIALQELERRARSEKRPQDAFTPATAPRIT